MKKIITIITTLVLIPFLFISSSKALTANEITNDEYVYWGNYYKDIVNQPIARNDGEVWTLVDYEVLYEKDVLLAQKPVLVVKGEQITKDFTWNIGANSTIILGGIPITISVGVSNTTTYTRNGPNSNDRLIGGRAATHRAFTQVVSGAVVKYNYKVTNKYTGNFLRNDTLNVIVSPSEECMSQLINYDGRNVLAMNTDETKVKTVTYNQYNLQFSKSGRESIGMMVF